ncbi:MAG: hypothetical protein EA411_04020 [Saprospirales bacterium]|nr:MAG: hypothetical protein EA411_04020 [Saprospirales bacterium]
MFTAQGGDNDRAEFLSGFTLLRTRKILRGFAAVHFPFFFLGALSLGNPPIHYVIAPKICKFVAESIVGFYLRNLFTE